MPKAVADRDEDAELGPSSCTEDADDGEEDEALAVPKLLAMYRCRELLRFGIGMLLRRPGEVDSGGAPFWETSILGDQREDPA